MFRTLLNKKKFRTNDISATLLLADIEKNIFLLRFIFLRNLNEIFIPKKITKYYLINYILFFLISSKPS